MTANAQYGSAAAVVARMPSPKIWADCPVLQFQSDPAKGFHLFDDFKNSHVITSNSTVTDFSTGVGHVSGDINWYAYDEGDKVANLAVQSDDDGWLMLDTDGTDDDVIGISTGDNIVGMIRTPLKGERKKFWFECRFKVNTITNTDLSFFIGLHEPNKLANGVPLGAAPTAPADNDYLGFFVAEADGDDLTIIYNEAALGTAQSDTGEITLVADTFIRVGFRLDVDSDKIHVYVDGVDQGSDAEIDVDSANFPSNTNMGLLICATSGAAGADSDNLKIDWIRVAQEI